MYSYPNVLGKAIKETVNIGQLLVEISSFANPYPYVSKSIDCFIAQFFRRTGNDALIDDYGLQAFTFFPSLWSNLKDTYLKELPAIAFSTIPSEDAVSKSFEKILTLISPSVTNHP